MAYGGVLSEIAAYSITWLLQNTFLPPYPHVTYVKSVYGAWGKNSRSLAVMYMFIDLFTLTNLCLLDSLEWSMWPVGH